MKHSHYKLVVCYILKPHHLLASLLHFTMISVQRLLRSIVQAPLECGVSPRSVIANWQLHVDHRGGIYTVEIGKAINQGDFSLPLESWF